MAGLFCFGGDIMKYCRGLVFIDTQCVYVINSNVINVGVLLVWFRGRGPLKSTMDVIGAAKKISEAGANLDKFCRQVADQVTHSLISYSSSFYFLF